MFCHSLRRRPSWAPVVASLASRSVLGLREQQLGTHDLALPLPATDPAAPAAYLRVLLLSPSNLASTHHVEATLDRIQRLSTTATIAAQPVLAVFLLHPPRDAAFRPASELATRDEDRRTGSSGPDDGDDDDAAGILAYTALQAELLNHACPPVPILLLQHVHRLPALLEHHMAVLSEPPSAPPSARSPTRDLLSLCGRAMAHPHAVNHLHDTFNSIPEIAQTSISTSSLAASSPPDIDAMHMGFDLSTPEGRMIAIKSLAGEQATSRLLDFWRNEWNVD